jgi:hypothetical protein
MPYCPICKEWMGPVGDAPPVPAPLPPSETHIDAYLASITRPAQETPEEVAATVETPAPRPQTPKPITLHKQQPKHHR